MKSRIGESLGHNVEDLEEDTAKITHDTDKVKGDGRQSRGEPDSPVEGLVPRALHVDLGLGSGNDVAPALHSAGEENVALRFLELSTDVEMPPPPDEDVAEDLDRDAVLCSGDDTDVCDKDNIVQKLRAEIAALRGHGPCGSSLKRESESPTAPELGQKGVVRKVQTFQVCDPDNEGPVKTRTVARVAPTLKAIVVMTRNMAKGDKVRTRGMVQRRKSRINRGVLRRHRRGRR